MIPPALRGIIRDAIRRQWPTLRTHDATSHRDSDLIIDWYGTTYRIQCTAESAPKAEKWPQIGS